MKRLVLLAASLAAAPALAHPIEPLVTASPTTVPRDMMNADLGYRVVRDDGAVTHDVELTVSAGIGGRAELSIAGSIDGDGNVGAATLGAKVLLLMEGPTGLDLAVAAQLGSDRSAAGSLLAGRTVVPGLYLQAELSVHRASAAVGALGVGVHRAALALPHGGGITEPGDGTAVTAGAAAQWAPIPRLLPGIETRWTRASDGDVSGWVVPEALFLIDMNHLSVKLGVPIGVQGTLDVGLIAALNWQG